MQVKLKWESRIFDEIFDIGAIKTRKSSAASDKWYHWRQYVLGPDSVWRQHLTSIGNTIVEIRRLYDRLISKMGFPILVRWHLYIESGPWLLYQWTTKAKLILFFGPDTRHRGQGIPLIMRKIGSEINTSYSKNSRSTLKQKCCHFDEIFITGWTKDVRMASDQSCSWPEQPVAYHAEEVNVNPGLTKPHWMALVV